MPPINAMAPGNATCQLRLVMHERHALPLSETYIPALWEWCCCGAHMPVRLVSMTGLCRQVAGRGRVQ